MKEKKIKIDIEQQANTSKEMDFTQLLKIFLKMKWWFITAFIIIFLAGTAYVFLKTPTYNSYSVIKPLEKSQIELLDAYYPEQNNKFGTVSIDIINLELKSDTLLRKAMNSLIKEGHEVSFIDFKESIIVTLDNRNKIVTINTYYNNPDISYLINMSIIDTYVFENKKRLSEVYYFLLRDIENELLLKNGKIDELLLKIEESLIDINIKLNYKLRSENMPGSYEAMNFVAINYIPPVLVKDIERLISESADLNKIKELLVINKDYYINTIDVIVEPKEPTIIKNNILKQISFILIISIFSGCVVLVISNYFISLKKRKRSN